MLRKQASAGMGTWILSATKMLLVVQATQSGLVGTIRDEESGTPLAGATVVLPNLHRSIASDSLGRYVFRQVPPGRQLIVVQRLGYFPRTLSALVSREGEVQINIAMRPAPMRLPGMVVRAPVPVRGTQPEDSTAYPDREVSIAAIRVHPLLAEPDGFLALDGGEIAVSPESPSGIHVRGGSSDQTAYLLDGIPVFSPYHAAGTFSAWNPDALARLKVTSASLSPDFPDALSGTVAAVTRTPGSLVRAQGGMSTTHARLAVDGPIGGAGAGYLLSYRSGFPGVLAPNHEASYLRGNNRDVLAKVEVPVGGGRLHALIYDGQNGINGAASTDTTARSPANLYQWHSQSIGIQWLRGVGSGLLRVQAWTASGDADVNWTRADTTPVTVTSDRRDGGVLAAVERSLPGANTSAGARLQWSRTLYRVSPLNSDPSVDLEAHTPVAAVFLQHRRDLGKRLSAGLGGSGAVADHQLYLNLQSRLDWRPSHALLLSVGYTRSHQYAQSLRNPESVVGNVFPADLYLGAGNSGVPVARSDRGLFAVEYRPASQLRLGAQLYLTASGGLVLVAPSTVEPFATERFMIGSARVPGFSLEAGWSQPAFGLTASYGWQRVRLRYAASTYTPGYGASHQVEVGATVFPWTNSSIRLGATGVFGRHATAVDGGFEWEACNLLDRGCEFRGSPRTAEGLGGTRLPAYMRLDLSLRRQWHLVVGQREVTMGLFATLSNLLGRHNLLTVVTDPASGGRNPIEMRPLAPLVAGLDWRF